MKATGQPGVSGCVGGGGGAEGETETENSKYKIVLRALQRWRAARDVVWLGLSDGLVAVAAGEGPIPGVLSILPTTCCNKSGIPRQSIRSVLRLLGSSLSVFLWPPGPEHTALSARQGNSRNHKGKLLFISETEIHLAAWNFAKTTLFFFYLIIHL